MHACAYILMDGSYKKKYYNNHYNLKLFLFKLLMRDLY